MRAVQQSQAASSADCRELELMQMERLFDALFPICRSITGPGLRDSLRLIGEHLPLVHFGVPTGTKVFDWEIPPEWHIRSARLTGPAGEILADFARSNLHVVNYSEPIDQAVTLDALLPHLHSRPDLPEAIPYVTSYYKRRWGFCLPHRVVQTLTPGSYQALIDSRFVKGELNFAHALLPGSSDREVLIGAYLCHPSLANNELSGPIVASFLYSRLKAWSHRRFTYRFVFAPETIGSLTYLHRFGKELREKLHAGVVLTCLGGQGPSGGKIPLSYKSSRQGNSPLDSVIGHLFSRREIDGVIRPFTPSSGSDERQYNSPGFNLPVGQIARAVYGEYPGYHNSLDTKEFMTITALQQSLDELEQLLQGLELDGYYVNSYPCGEVKLDKHELYPDKNAPSTWQYSNNQILDGRELLNRVLWLLNASDGETPLHQIAERCDCSLIQLGPVVALLKEKGLLMGPFSEKRSLEPWVQKQTCASS